MLKQTKALNSRNFKKSSAPLRIGSAKGDYNWNGSIDEVKIYTGALTAKEIKNIYDNEKVGKNSDGKDREAVEAEISKLSK